RYHELHHLAFAPTERGIAGTQIIHLGLLLKRGATAVDGAAYSADQSVVAEWLGQELERTSLHGAYRRWYIGITSNEHDGHIGSVHRGDILQVQTAEIWERHIQYQAVRDVRSRARKEFLGAREGFGLPPGALD